MYSAGSRQRQPKCHPAFGVVEFCKNLKKAQALMNMASVAIANGSLFVFLFAVYAGANAATNDGYFFRVGPRDLSHLIGS